MVHTNVSGFHNICPYRANATALVRGVTVGTGIGTAKPLAKRGAAVQALQYFKAHGIPPDNTSRE